MTIDRVSRCRGLAVYTVSAETQAESLCTRARRARAGSKNPLSDPNEILHRVGSPASSPTPHLVTIGLGILGTARGRISHFFIDFDWLLLSSLKYCGTTMPACDDTVFRWQIGKVAGRCINIEKTRTVIFGHESIGAIDNRNLGDWERKRITVFGSTLAWNIDCSVEDSKSNWSYGWLQYLMEEESNQQSDKAFDDQNVCVKC